jgi:hypothetical protein
MRVDRRVMLAWLHQLLCLLTVPEQQCLLQLLLLPPPWCVQLLLLLPWCVPELASVALVWYLLWPKAQERTEDSCWSLGP